MVKSEGSSGPNRDALVQIASAMRGVTRFRVDLISVKTDADGSKVTRTTTIRVVDDVFGSTTDEGEWPQRLTYKGVDYVRDRDTSPWMREPGGHWVSLEGRIDVIDEGPGRDPDLEVADFAFDLHWFLNGDTLPSRTVGALELRGFTADNEVELPRMADDMIRQMERGGLIVEESNKQEFLANLAKIPTRTKTKSTVWFGADSMVHEFQGESWSYREDELLETIVGKSTYSDYGTAELPGPLPGA